MVTAKCPGVPATLFTSERVWMRMFGCLWTSTIFGERMHIEQSFVGNVLSSCAICPPMVGSRSTRCTVTPWFARSSAAWIPATPPPMTTTSLMGIFPGEFHVGGCVLHDMFALSRCCLFDRLARDAEHDRARRNLHTLGNHCPGADDGDLRLPQHH